MKIHKYLFFSYIFILLFLFILSIMIGSGVSYYTPVQIINVLYDFDANNIDYQIITMRIIRTYSSFLVGGSLALSGSILQRLTRNPLADPYILGISSGASVFAAITVILSFPVFFMGLPVRIVMSLVGAIISLIIILVVKTRFKNISDDYSIPLIGLILNSFYGAILMLIVTFANSNRVSEVHKWLIGSIQFIEFKELLILNIISFINIIILIYLAPLIQVLVFGDEFAISLGISAKRLRKISFVLVSLLIAVAVSISGSIGFIGLIIPHFVQRLHNNKCRLELLASFILGASILLFADILARNLLSPSELPVGIFTALIGTPLLAYILLKKK